MSVKRIQIKASLTDKKVTIPIGQNFDEVGREQLINTWEQVELQDNINLIQDYETTRYSYNNKFGGNKVHYAFEFYDENNGTYVSDFNILGYKDFELNRTKESFKKSFFKFDYYDSPVREEQKLMFSVIMPANNCIREEVAIDFDEDPVSFYAQSSQGVPVPAYDIYKPNVVLSPQKGNDENYYIQWLKDRELYEGNTFYMSCKFFNGKDGSVIRMLNRNPLTSTPYPPPPIPSYPPGAYDYADWFYHQVILKIDSGNINAKHTYTIHPFTNLNLGGMISNQIGDNILDPIRFYEYITK
jgi:hypothetical protein